MSKITFYELMCGILYCKMICAAKPKNASGGSGGRIDDNANHNLTIIKYDDEDHCKNDYSQEVAEK